MAQLLNAEAFPTTVVVLDKQGLFCFQVARLPGFIYEGFIYLIILKVHVNLLT